MITIRPRSWHSCQLFARMFQIFANKRTGRRTDRQTDKQTDTLKSHKVRLCVYEEFMKNFLWKPKFQNVHDKTWMSLFLALSWLSRMSLNVMFKLNYLFSPLWSESISCFVYLIILETDRQTDRQTDRPKQKFEIYIFKITGIIYYFPQGLFSVVMLLK